jgi:osmotically-inducible protein OsmY
VEHTRSIEVIAENGNVTLRGYVLRDELEDVLDTARHVNGVRKVRSEMQIKDSVEDIPA